MTVAIDTFRVFSAFTSTVMLLSPMPMIYSVYKAKNTGVMSIVPLISMLAHSNTTLFYGYLTEHYFPIVSTFLLGDLLCLSYIAIFYVSSHEKAKAHKVFTVYGVPLTLLSIYGFLGGYGVTGQTRHDAGSVFGYAGIVTNLVLYSSYFEKIALVLKHRSAVFFVLQHPHGVCWRRQHVGLGRVHGAYEAVDHYGAVVDERHYGRRPDRVVSDLPPIHTSVHRPNPRYRTNARRSRCRGWRNHAVKDETHGNNCQFSVYSDEVTVTTRNAAMRHR